MSEAKLKSDKNLNKIRNPNIHLAQSAGTAEYSDYISAEG